MKVIVQFMGPLKDYVGRGAEEFVFAGPATYQALLQEIGKRFGQCFPKGIWDENAGGFKKGILVMGEGRDLDDPATPLSDGEVIKILPLLGGG